MLRYHLRTLLIVVTACCLVLSCVTHSRRMADHHRQKAAHLISKSAQLQRTRPADVENGLQLREDNAGKTRYAAKLFGQTVVTLQVKTGWQSVFQTDPADWERAIYHRKQSKTYERAVWRPWLLISDKPTR